MTMKKFFLLCLLALAAVCAPLLCLVVVVAKHLRPEPERSVCMMGHWR